MAPSISIREHIRWLPERESEPTSTLVLTSPENRFVDIRILKPRFFGVNEGTSLMVRRLKESCRHKQMFSPLPGLIGRLVELPLPRLGH